MFRFGSQGLLLSEVMTEVNEQDQIGAVVVRLMLNRLTSYKNFINQLLTATL